MFTMLCQSYKEKVKGFTTDQLYITFMAMYHQKKKSARTKKRIDILKKEHFKDTIIGKEI